MGVGEVQDGGRRGTGWGQEGYRMGVGEVQGGGRRGTGWGQRQTLTRSYRKFSLFIIYIFCLCDSDLLPSSW